MEIGKLIEAYLAGVAELRDAVRDMTDEQLRARPVSGKWSTMEVICHIADYEPVCALRIKQILAFDQLTMQDIDPQSLHKRLAYHDRDFHEEMSIIAHTRGQMVRILRTLTDPEFERTGLHEKRGELTVADMIQNATDHLHHHVAFILEKRKLLGL